MMFKTLVLFLSLILSNFLFAQNSDLKDQSSNSFCEFYEKIDDDDYAKSLQGEELNKVLYSFPDRPSLNISTGDVLKWRYSTFSHVLEDNSKSFHKKMFSLLSFLNIETKAKYYTALPIENTAESEERFNQCLKDNFKSRQLAEMNQTFSSTKYKPEAYENFINAHILAALQAKAYLNKKEWIEEEFKKARIAVKDKYRFRNERGRYPAFEEELKELKKIETASLFVLMEDLYKVMQAYPLLFEIVKDPKIFNWMHKKVSSSPFMDALLSGIDEDILEAMFLRVQLEDNISAIGEIFLSEEVIQILNPVFLEKYTDPGIKQLAVSAAEDYLNLLNEKTSSICESKSHRLHYSYDLVNATWIQNTRHYDYKALTIKDQAAYCHLMRKDPPGEETLWNSRQKIGFYSFASGSAMSLVGGYGKYAYGLFLLGSGVFVYNSWDEYMVNEIELASHYSMLPHNFSNVRKVTDLVNKRGNIIVSGMIDLSLGVGGAGLVYAVDRAFSLAMARNYISMKKAFPGIPDRLAVYDLVLRSKAKQGLLLEGETWARAKIEILEKSRIRLYNKLNQKYKILSSRKKISSASAVLANNLEMPAYHIYRTKKGILGDIDAVLSVNIAKTQEGSQAIDRFLLKIKQYHTESQILNHHADEAFTGLAELPHLEKLMKMLSRSDFIDKKSLDLGEFGRLENGILKTKMPYYKQGKRLERDLIFRDFNEIKLRNQRAGASSKQSIANDIWSEFFMKSNMRLDLFRQAQDYRLYEIIARRLEGLADAERLTENQRKVLTELRLVLQTPVPMEQMIRVLNREIRFELYDGVISAVPFLKRLLFGNMKKMNDSDQLAFQIQRIAPVFNYFQVGVTATGFTIMWKLLDDFFDYGSSLHMKKEKALMAVRSFQRYLGDNYTYDEKECAESLRPLEFEICFFRLAHEELGYYRAKKMRDPSYFVHRDTEAKKAMRSFSYRMLKLRDILKTAEVRSFISTAQDRINERLFIEKLSEEVKRVLINRAVETEIIDAILYGLFVSEDSANLLFFESKLKSDYSVDIYEVIKEALASKGDLLLRMKLSGDLPVKIVDMLDDINKIEKNPMEAQELRFYSESYKSAVELLRQQKQEDDKIEQLLMKKSL